MKILYFGTVCDINEYDKLLENCSCKPSVAPIVFENALLDGFSKNRTDLEIHSFPMIPTFPSSKILHFGKCVNNLKSGYSCRWLNTWNLPLIKQFSRRMDARRILKKWGRENRGEGVVFTYSIPPFLVKDVIRFSKKYSLKTISIIPDLLRDMYINDNSKSFITSLKNLYLKPALKCQSRYDGYIYLTDAMHEVVAPQKPYMVMEGIADISSATPPDISNKAEKRSIMYAGMLHEKYGIINLLDAFDELSDKDTELWLFGDGSAVDQIKERAKSNPQIKYFGIVNRDEILKYEKKATLLINPRNPKDEFTKYSFPSKTIEYMLSGTPLITTKLPGIPDEYFEFIFSVDSNEVESLYNAMIGALEKSDEELISIGKKAQSFILDNKHSQKQVKRIIDFIKEV